jgi:hypothetical protein
MFREMVKSILNRGHDFKIPMPFGSNHISIRLVLGRSDTAPRRNLHGLATTLKRFVSVVFHCLASLRKCREKNIKIVAMRRACKSLNTQREQLCHSKTKGIAPYKYTESWTTPPLTIEKVVLRMRALRVCAHQAQPRLQYISSTCFRPTRLNNSPLKPPFSRE